MDLHKAFMIGVLTGFILCNISPSTFIMWGPLLGVTWGVPVLVAVILIIVIHKRWK